MDPMTLFNVIVWIFAHWDAVAGVMYAIHALAVAIINLTNTPSDPQFAKYYRAVEVAAGQITPKAKK